MTVLETVSSLTGTGVFETTGKNAYGINYIGTYVFSPTLKV